MAPRIVRADQCIGVPREGCAAGVPGRRWIELQGLGDIGDESLGSVGVTSELGDGGEGAGGASELDREPERAQVVTCVEDSLGATALP